MNLTKKAGGPSFRSFIAKGRGRSGTHSPQKPILLAAFLTLALTGCHSRVIDAEVRNDGPTTLSPVEIDYPSASFGRATLAPGADFHYRFKVIGSGPTKAVWTDAAKADHTTTGPSLGEADEGALLIVLSGDKATLTFTPKPKP